MTVQLVVQLTVQLAAVQLAAVQLAAVHRKHSLVE